MRHNNLILAMLAVAAAFLSVLPLGYFIHQQYPTIPDRVLGAAAGIALAGTAGVALWLLLGGKLPKGRSPGPSRLRVNNRTMTEREMLRQRRVAELMADPARRKYAALVEQGQQWTDEQIAYNENPQLLATCPHLQPIEYAMRLAGIVPRLRAESWSVNAAPVHKIDADCCINEPELNRQFPLPPSVHYTQGYYPERHPLDNPWAQLTCSECDSNIELVHPEWPRTTTQWFPIKPTATHDL